MKLTLIALLGILLFWLGYHFNQFGFLKTEATGASEKAVVTSAETSATPVVANLGEPTPTPLPPHFPTVTENDLHAVHHGELMPLTKAYSTCWPDAAAVPEPTSDDLTMDHITELFGHLKKKEVLEQNGDETKLGLIFEPEVFKAGAAGAATEVRGKIRDFQVRAGGQIIHCGVDEASTDDSSTTDAADEAPSANCRCL